HTVVESYEGGWAWSVPSSRTRRYVTVMVDPRVTAMRGGARLADSYRSELARTTALARLTSSARLRDEPFARDASPYGADRFGAPGALLVGDAASFVDPLSSYGLKKALASAWLAAVVVHTGLTDPQMSNDAVAFFDARERAMHAYVRRRMV